jgi:hypothetical protein
MTKKLKTIPKFKNERKEARFRAAHDSTEYVDYSKAKKVLFPNLKPSTKMISVADQDVSIGKSG